MERREKKEAKEKPLRKQLKKAPKRYNKYINNNSTTGSSS